MDPWQVAVQRFKSTLNEKETELFDKATAEEILNEVVKIEQYQRKSSKLRRWSDGIKPLLDVIDDYGRAFDVLANASSVLPPLWGSLRVLLIVGTLFRSLTQQILNYPDCTKTQRLLFQTR